MDLYAVSMVLGAYVLTHIFLSHASVVAHMQKSYCRFHSHMVRTSRLLWSLLIVTWYIVNIIELRNIQLTFTQWAHLSKAN